MGRPKSSEGRIGVGLTAAAMDRLEEVAVLAGRQVGTRAPSVNILCTWIVHGILTLPEKQMIKLIAAGKARAESDLKGGNPGTNGHRSTGRGGLHIAPEDRERIVPRRPLPGSSRKHSEAASHDAAPHTTH